MAKWIWVSTEQIKAYRNALKAHYPAADVRKLTDAQIVSMALKEANASERTEFRHMIWDLSNSI